MRRHTSRVICSLASNLCETHGADGRSADRSGRCRRVPRGWNELWRRRYRRVHAAGFRSRRRNGNNTASSDGRASRSADLSRRLAHRLVPKRRMARRICGRFSWFGSARAFVWSRAGRRARQRSIVFGIDLPACAFCVAVPVDLDALERRRCGRRRPIATTTGGPLFALAQRPVRRQGFTLGSDDAVEPDTRSPVRAPPRSRTQAVSANSRIPSLRLKGLAARR